MAHEMRIVHMQSLAGYRLARDQCTCRKWHPPPRRLGPLDALCAGVKNVANVKMLPMANNQFPMILATKNAKDAKKGKRR